MGDADTIAAFARGMDQAQNRLITQALGIYAGLGPHAQARFRDELPGLTQKPYDNPCKEILLGEPQPCVLPPPPENVRDLTFAEILPQVQAGTAMARRSRWKPNRFIYLRPGNSTEYSHLRLRMEDYKSVPWGPNRCDLFEHDWEIIPL